MKQTYYTDGGKGAALLAIACGFAVCGVALAVSHSILGAGIFLCLAGVYLLVGLNCFTTVTLDSQGVRQQSLGRERSRLAWEQIGEIGICGTRLGRRDVGALYIYISPQPLENSRRLDMVLKWPPRKVLYFRYHPECLSLLGVYWDKALVLYNTGDFSL